MTEHYNKEFCYKKTTHWKEEDTSRIGYEVVCDHLVFSRFRSNKDLSISYKCKEAKKGCKSSITISSIGKVVYFVEHDNEIEHKKLEEKDYLNIMFKETLIEAVKQDSTTPHQQLFDNKRAEIINTI